MKYFIFVVLAVLLLCFNCANARLYTEAEALADMQSYWDNYYRNPPTKADRERIHKEAVARSQIPGNYRGSGDILEDRDIYIDGKLYHCIVYKSNTQCHTH